MQKAKAKSVKVKLEKLGNRAEKQPLTRPGKPAKQQLPQQQHLLRVRAKRGNQVPSTVKLAWKKPTPALLETSAPPCASNI